MCAMTQDAVLSGGSILVHGPGLHGGGSRSGCTPVAWLGALTCWGEGGVNARARLKGLGPPPGNVASCAKLAGPVPIPERRSLPAGRLIRLTLAARLRCEWSRSRSFGDIGLVRMRSEQLGEAVGGRA
jgi:hypothetical protein